MAYLQQQLHPVTAPNMLSLAAAARLGACTLSRGVFNASSTALRTAGGSKDAVREYATGDLTDGKPKTILAVLYKVTSTFNNLNLHESNITSAGTIAVRVHPSPI